ncbi:hypothetical protein WKK05_32160 [Nostoc sp. UHCC 0302]|uniref:hypothetical protein n=1 Tax=Nostoc sp. UHCC 0302 TaxID=3134896 RepID=UPI00311CB3C3
MKSEVTKKELSKVLETQFGEVPSSIIEFVNGINDLCVLRKLLKIAIAIPSTAEFQKLLDSIASEE